eukprot:TRINITY_DN114436_c0_g1_i1.p1 TRINITY_DN114436_c0_g1~~TRINITY_DN114436_c0_g1_i1.p1  ORF type:complete len:213 (+),score=25.09 TRINITY_DN114436_c0_g1_i1:37-675(+)
MSMALSPHTLHAYVRLPSKLLCSRLAERRTDKLNCSFPLFASCMSFTGLAITFFCRRLKARRSACARSCRAATRDNSSLTSDRRCMLKLMAGMAGAGQPCSANAAITGTFREALSDMTTKMGGAPGDIYYPPWFLGDWTANAELVAVETPQGDSLASSEALAARSRVGSSAALTQYPLRFISYRGQVIADRAYGVRSFLLGCSGGDTVKTIE